MSTEEDAPNDPGWDDLTPEQKQRVLQLASGGVTRRDVLAGGGALAVGGLLGGGASQALTEPAAASHGAGSVGEAGNPINTAYVTSIDGDGDDISVAPGFGSINVNAANVGNDATYTPVDRPLISNQDQTVNVPTDYSTLQDALDDVPIILRHQYKVAIDAGTYTEGGFVHAFMSDRPIEGTANKAPGVVIVGDEATPSNVEIPWILATGCGTVSLRGLTFNSENPHTNESASVEFYACEEGAVADCLMVADPDGTNPDTGVEAYRSYVHVGGVDFGTDVRKYGIYTKHGGVVHEEPSRATPTTGNVTERAYNYGGDKIVIQASSSTLTGTNGLAQGATGFIWDAENQAFITANNTMYQRFYKNRPSPRTSQAMYFDNGAGTNTAGWHFTNDGGSTWTAV